MGGSNTLLIGSWINAIGTIVVALSEIKDLTSDQPVSDTIVELAGIMELLGLALMRIDIEEGLDEGTDNMIESFGDADDEELTYLSLVNPSLFGFSLFQQIIGGVMDAAISAFSPQTTNFDSEEEKLLISKLLQSLGIGLELLGVFTESKGDVETADFIAAQGSIIQSVGALIFAGITTKEYIETNKSKKS